ncbi:succinate dehydrogenase, hydrophobic membrane anchor protein [Jannaschia formosa]|uniref:succinate dehydrogenase, hydrophobic membrane anchor protein n=1 Tax=Jannaschia formosa TaxID=2259592 RepID=UPI000E1BD968|nr:succinate dehydrogenase, hydrophobic membrane anchor protein [Jannaschia formosa]TFL19426.1 succinate dehydrogenase, hydrophobic membrane anchor protein [Jannaschia formosa]
MPYITDRKRVTGFGSAHSGTQHFWRVTISSVALLILVPFFVFTFGTAVGEPWEVVVAYYSRPFPALIAALTLAVGWYHFAKGVHVLITDYSRGMTRKILLIGAHILCYAAALVSLWALVRLAL